MVALAAAVTALEASVPAKAFQPSVNFQLQCMGCHRADGSGQPGRVPSIRHSLLAFSRSEAGRAFVVRVPGVAQSSLSDEETASLLNWMARTLSDDWTAGAFREYSAPEVHSLRGTVLTEVAAKRISLTNALRLNRR